MKWKAFTRQFVLYFFTWISAQALQYNTHLHRKSCIRRKVWPGFYIRLNQRWLWNFPEGPCSPCCSPSDCQSLTSTAAAIGWRANRVEHYWSAELCHTDHSVAAPLFLLQHIFCCNAEISPVLHCEYSFCLSHIITPGWYKLKEIWKRCGLWTTTSRLCSFTLTVHLISSISVTRVKKVHDLLQQMPVLVLFLQKERNGRNVSRKAGFKKFFYCLRFRLNRLCVKQREKETIFTSPTHLWLLTLTEMMQ